MSLSLLLARPSLSLSNQFFFLRLSCRSIQSGLIVFLSFSVSPSVSLTHTSSVCVCATEVVHHWQQHTHTHSYNHSFPLFCSSIATLYSCHSPGISLSLSTSPLVRVAHTSCLCTCPTAPYPNTHTHTRVPSQMDTHRQAQRAVCVTLTEWYVF